MSGRTAKALRRATKHHPSNPVALVKETGRLIKGKKGAREETGSFVLDPRCTRSKYQIIKRNLAK